MMKASKLKLFKTPYRKDTHFLLAMSGGVDSCVLFNLFRENNVVFSVAHVNYGLRTSATHDQEFVEQICRRSRVKCYVHTVKSQPEENESVQNWARKIRYDFMHSIIEEHEPEIIVTAHHLDDSLETFFINFTRSTGIAGLLGIGEEEKIWRPLLPFTKEDIVQYAVMNKIDWREDQSNAGTAYLRNQIRWNLIPPLKEIAPNVEQTFLQNIEKWREDYEILQYAVEKKNQKLWKKEGDYKSISIEKVKKLTPQRSWVFHLFRKAGFNHPEEVMKLMNSNTGSEIVSETHRLLKNREQLLLYPLKKKFVNSWEIASADFDDIAEEIPYSFELLDELPDEKLADTVLLDFDKLTFPLKLQSAGSGESFKPAGMGHKSKKISKYLKDQKLSKFDKEKVLILYNANGDTISVANLRADERFAPTEKTKKWLKISQK
ncbi:MAG: tRNA lysidine(34) synthetase TilS [Weeksellaceae bacterium]|nr:tRNA lysidine(34) synthetase TilS [Weeksellaceae bacterium]